MLIKRFGWFSKFTGFVTWNVTIIPFLIFVAGVIHEGDNAYLFRSNWLCYQQIQFLTVADKHTLDTPTNKDQRSLVFLNDPKNTLLLTENLKKYFPKSKP